MSEAHSPEQRALLLSPDLNPRKDLVTRHGPAFARVHNIVFLASE